VDPVTAYLFLIFVDNLLKRRKDEQWNINDHPLQVWCLHFVPPQEQDVIERIYKALSINTLLQ
jgi:hypothetical protein